METDAETHSQTLGGRRSGRRIAGARGVKDVTRKQAESSNLGSWGLRELRLVQETEPPNRKPARTYLSPL